MIYWKNRTQKLAVNKNNTYCKNIFTLDTETTSLFINKKTGKVIKFDKSKPTKFYEDYNKVGFVYIWMLGIDDTIYYGRELNELHDFIMQLNEEAKGKKVVMYCHNLAFDFQFLRNIFDFKVFAREQRKVMKCEIIDTTIEIRCSYVLTNMSLENVAKQNNLPVQKQVGSLDYDKIRNTKTILTEEELKYCEYDCLVIYHYIKLMLQKYRTFKNIPLTATGKVRKELKKYIAEHNGNKEGIYNLKNWKRKISKLTEDTYTFENLVRCFSGGYTHANAYYYGAILKNVYSIDFTSSYPAVMLSEKFPMTNFKKCDVNEKLNFNMYAYIIKVRFYNISSNKLNNYIQYEKCKKTIKNFTADNGRIDAADFLEITCTEQDYQIIIDNYDFDKQEIVELYKSRKQYLPKVFIEFIIKTYERKCILKDKLKEIEKTIGKDSVEYKDTEVALRDAKSMLNSLYGMCATNLINDNIYYECGEWHTDVLNQEKVAEMLEEQKDDNMLLPYMWAPWITAYARRNLWWMIERIDDDVIYCDTDSVKYLNNHDEKINEYNKMIDKKVNDMLKYYKITSTYLNGIGRFDKEHGGKSFTFKTLGAKKYVVEDENGIEITLAGVNKRTGSKAIKSLKDFKNGFTFTYDTSGKLTHSYNDMQDVFKCVDYQGNSEVIKQQYGICLYPTTYIISTTDEYIDYVKNATYRSEYLNNL